MGQDLSRDLPMTAYALLGLLSFGDPLTGYELKQRADRTLRYYWVSPAMSQVYSELERLHDLGLVRRHGDERTTSYSMTAAGTDGPDALDEARPRSASRCSSTRSRCGSCSGALVDPEAVTRCCATISSALEEERTDLEKVRVSLEGRTGPGAVPLPGARGGLGAVVLRPRAHDHRGPAPAHRRGNLSAVGLFTHTSH